MTSRRRRIGGPLLLFGGGAAPAVPWYLDGGARIGSTAVETTYPLFGCFVVEKT